MNRNDLDRVLVRGVNWLGDAIMTTPALQRLRERFSNARITLLTPEKLADLWPGQPCIDSVMTFGPRENVWSIARRFRREGFQAALVLPNSPRSALEAWLAGVPSRIGYARPWRKWLLTQAIPERPERVSMRKRSIREVKRLVSSATASPRATGTAATTTSEWPIAAHQVHEYLHLVAAMGANPEPLPPKLVVSAEEVEGVALKFQLPRMGAESGPLLGLNPGAEYGAAKRWPASRFIAVARAVQQRTQCRWLILGGTGDAPLANEIAGAISRLSPPPLNLAGKTSLRELCAVLKLCRAFLTNDTGPMHVAAALDTPVVALFGSTSPALTGPTLARDSRNCVITGEAACTPCFRRTCPIDFRCMLGINIERVIEAVVQAANSWPATRAGKQ